MILLVSWNSVLLRMHQSRAAKRNNIEELTSDNNCYFKLIKDGHKSHSPVYEL